MHVMEINGISCFLGDKGRRTRGKERNIREGRGTKKERGKELFGRMRVTSYPYETCLNLFQKDLLMKN